MDHIFCLGGLAVWLELRLALLLAKNLKVLSRSRKIKYDLKIQMVQWSTDISWVAGFNPFHSCTIMKLLKHLMSFTLLDSNDLEVRDNDLLLNVSCCPTMLSSVARQQLMFSKCEMVNTLSVTEDDSGTSGPNSPILMRMCWVHSNHVHQLYPILIISYLQDHTTLLYYVLKFLSYGRECYRLKEGLGICQLYLQYVGLL